MKIHKKNYGKISGKYFKELTTCYKKSDAISGDNCQIKTTCVILHSVVPNQCSYLSIV